ncbi:hypothetical protein OAE72_01255 [Akkermansiaceae bacterium]|nr:hypothetical protein [Akkermansiaceae bacterium]
MNLNSPASHDPILCGARHALFWMVAANCVGLLLSILLLAPKLGLIFGEWTYGRWLPLHLNWQLYGWTALPLIAWVFFLFKESTRSLARASVLGIWAWSTCLMLGGFFWLSGHTSGKIFLDWTGAMRILFPVVILFLWGVLFFAWRKDDKRHLRALPGLLALLIVPFALYFATDPTVYPAVDESTGGPTGASLLNSTLSVVFLLLLVPRALRNPPGSASLDRKIWIFFFLNLILGIYAETLPPSHHHPGQIACLATLLVWPVLLSIYYSRLHWRNSHPRWQRALFVWFGILALNGFTSFLPGILDRIKFTDALVAHSHLAMAGFTTSFLIFLLQQILPQKRAVIFDHTPAFVAWHLATIGYVTLMLISGILDSIPHSPAGLHHLLYGLRSLCGLILTLVSIHWWRGLNS